MQNIITLGQINDALKFTTVTAAQLAEMGFAALANKPICEALPQEEARRLRTAKLYPAESIGQIRVALAKRLAAPASCLHQIQEPAPVQTAQTVAPEFNLKTSAGGRGYVSWYFSNVMQRYDFGNYITKTLAADFACALASWLRDGKPRVESQAEPAVVAAPGERSAFEAWASKAGYSIERWKNDYLLYADQKTDIAWEIWQARAALAATPAAVDVPATERMMQLVDAWFSQMKSGNVISQGIARQRIVMFVDALATATVAAAPVVLPDPDAVISEVMGLVDEWGMESHLRGEAELDAQHSEATQEEIDCAKDRASKERAAWKAIESKLRALLAAGGEAQAAPAFYAALGSNGCALPQYSAGTEEGVILNVLSVARNEGYTGSGLDRLIELGWVVRPVYTRPTPATADSLATATGLPAQPIAYLRAAATLPEYGGLQIWKNDGTAFPVFGAPQAQADARDADGEAFRTAARLRLTLRFYGNCAQSGAPGTPSVYEVTTGPDSAEAMRASIDRAAIAAAKGESNASN